MNKVMKKIYLILCVIGMVMIGSGCRQEILYIAAVGSDYNIADGKTYSQGSNTAFNLGAKLYFEETAREFSEKGYTIEVLAYNDYNDRTRAVLTAKGIVLGYSPSDMDAVFKNAAEGELEAEYEAFKESGFSVTPGLSVSAVIGHRKSDASLAAGVIYQEAGIPAITPSSTDVKVTRDNPWYFRTVYKDDLQGSSLANYAKQVLNAQDLVIIYQDNNFAAGVKNFFLSAWDEDSIFIEDTGETEDILFLKPDDEDIFYRILGKDDIEAFMLENLKSRLAEKIENPNTLIFISADAEAAGTIARKLREWGVENTILGPDTLSTEVFQKRLFGTDNAMKDYRYSKNMYIATPLIYDIANEKGLTFFDRYFERFGKTPDWGAAYSYDSAMLFSEALLDHISHVHEGEEGALSIGEVRQEIRDFLTAITEADDRFLGATGYNFFDSQGDALKPIMFGYYERGIIISALSQLHVLKEDQIEYFQEQGEDMVEINEFSMLRTRVVYTGIEINSVESLDMLGGVSTLDFYLWFRYQGDIDISKIDLLNTVDPVFLPANMEESYENFDKASFVRLVDTFPKRKAEPSELQYRRYHLRLEVKNNFLMKNYKLGQYAIGLNFRHQNMYRDRLIFVIDQIGMENLKSPTRQGQIEKYQKLLRSSSGWMIKDHLTFVDTDPVSIYGEPHLLQYQEGTIDFSRFNFALIIAEGGFNVREVLNDISTDLLLTWLIISVIIFSSIFITNRATKRFKRVLLIPQIIAGYILLFSIEQTFGNWIINTFKQFNPETVRLFFDVLWWMYPAAILIVVVNRFFWGMLETRIKRQVPKFAKMVAAVAILLIFLFLVVAFVLKQQITSLIATSGFIALIVGMANKSEVSNITAGITINLDAPFSIGDFITIDGVGSGKVIDIRWRTTIIRCDDHSILCVPNGTVVSGKIQNLSYKNNSYSISIDLHIDPKHDPQRICKILTDSVLSYSKVETEPAPTVLFTGFSDWAANYKVVFSAASYSEVGAIREAVWNRIWIHLHRAGIEPAIHRLEMYQFEGEKARGFGAAIEPITILDEIDIFAPFPKAAKEDIASKMSKIELSGGSVVIREGEASDSLFIIAEGVVGVQVKVENSENKLEIARMGAGHILGEMALITGEPRTADIVALTDMLLYEIRKDDLAPYLEEFKAIYQSIREVVKTRKIEHQEETARRQEVEPPKEGFWDKVKRKLKGLFRIEG